MKQTLRLFCMATSNTVSTTAQRILSWWPTPCAKQVGQAATTGTTALSLLVVSCCTARSQRVGVAFWNPIVILIDLAIPFCDIVKEDAWHPENKTYQIAQCQTPAIAPYQSLIIVSGRHFFHLAAFGCPCHYPWYPDLLHVGYRLRPRNPFDCNGPRLCISTFGYPVPPALPPPSLNSNFSVHNTLFAFHCCFFGLNFLSNQTPSTLKFPRRHRNQDS